MAEVPPVPKTTKDAVIAIWYKIFNGLSAAVEETRCLAKDTAGRVQTIEGVLPTLWTREQHEKMHAEYIAECEAKAKEKQEHGERRKMSRRDVIMLLLVGIGTLAGIAFGVIGMAK